MAGVADVTLFSLVHDYFKVYLPKRRECSPHTIRSYQNTIESLLDFVKVKKDIRLSEITFEMIDHNMLSAYLDHLGAECNCSVSTQNLRLSHIRAFYTYAAKMKPSVVIHLAEIRKVPKKKIVDQDIVEYMSENAILTILEQPDATTKKGLRDQFLMLMLYDTAARIQEALNIRLRDIHLGKSPTVTLHGKGSKVRTVPLLKKTVIHFRNYTNVFHPGEGLYSEEYLFYVPRRGQKNRMSENNARKLIAAYGTAAQTVCPEIPDCVHPHLFRHSRAMHLYQRGMDLILISQWLGHAQPDTTLIYAHADTEQKRKAIEASTSPSSPLKKALNSQRFTVDDEDTLKKLYGLR